MEKPNFLYIDNLCSGDKAFKARLLQIVKEELPDEIQKYRESVLSNNLPNIAACVHKLKHKISILGMEENYHMAERFEENLKSGSYKGRGEFEAILQVMTDFVEEL
ncbi:Hpt domain-containing protein [Aureisphaera galaxeae]|uniref:Hpt domain-containing protein n=1 Tax=Aureisphaera galaxeae TaxID=1538023 RepID=UPI0023501BA6|nr:Hpt domain-containing protein [Aureisphaera galaxeae]MDC8005692.1 Hpt domain-containing protein [Aureisphaera galaxeae]